MARDLKPGDRLETARWGGRHHAIQPDKPQRVYNVDVAGNGDLFVGPQGLLVHDFGFVQPVLEPFDRRPDLARPEPSGR